ncbi:MAG: hypothetical protein IJ356_06430 [Erysipelotrichaceae bacterium]|nr:hypothetical protein [Erysipelotrichaceae bacterium]
MFGYIVTNKQELKFREFDEYRGFYCGLCRALKQRHGVCGQITLNYDLNFLAILLSALYEPETLKEQHRCVMHPLHKQMQYINPYLDYCADMNVILAYYKCQDDWQDDHSVIKHTEELMLRNSMERLEKQYPDKCRIISQQLSKINEYEKNNETNIDAVANAFGIVMAEIFACKKDEWHKTLYDMGFYLGKFIYLIDAYEDIEKDIKSGSFNLFKHQFNEEGFEEKMQMILEMMMAECTAAFERLPIFDYRDILRNILYSGVWSKYEMIKKKRRGE